MFSKENTLMVTDIPYTYILWKTFARLKEVPNVKIYVNPTKKNIIYGVFYDSKLFILKTYYSPKL